MNQTQYEGRIISQHHTLYRVMCADTELSASVCGKFRRAAADESDYPVVGDRVLLDRPDDSGGTAQILSMLPRKTLLTRTAAGSKAYSQPIAANIDYLFICMSCNRDYNISRLERYIAIAMGAGIKPVAVLTKSDLEEDARRLSDRLTEAHPDLTVLACSSATGDGIDSLRRLLTPDVTAAFAGSSGVGKSTLINALLGEEVMHTAAIREDDARGRHTTTHRQLFTMPNGCAIIDTPGMRALSLDNSDVDDTFEDIPELIARCRFSNCTHGNEPGCAVNAALADGTLDRRRWESYRKLHLEERMRRRRGKPYFQ